MYRWIFTICLFAFGAGCSVEPAKPPEKIEPTGQDRRVLQLYSLDPDSEAGQKKLRKLKRDRETLEKYDQERREALERRRLEESP